MQDCQDVLVIHNSPTRPITKPKYASESQKSEKKNCVPRTQKAKVDKSH